MSLVWTSGARSVAVMERDGYFSFTVPRGVAGVVVGLNVADTTTAPEEIQNGWFFELDTARTWEEGRAGQIALWNDGQTFHIARFGGHVYYCAGSTPTVVRGVTLPGQPVSLTTEQAVSGGRVVLDASLLAAGDRIDGMTFTEVAGTSDGEATLALPPLDVLGADDPYARAAVALPPLVLRGPDADLAMLPGRALLADYDFAVAALALPAPALRILAGEVMDAGVIAVALPPPWAVGYEGDQDDPSLRLAMLPAAVVAADEDFAQAQVALAAGEVFGLGADPVRVNAFLVRLPALSGASLGGNSATEASVDDTVLADEAAVATSWALVGDAGVQADDETPGSAATSALLEDRPARAGDQAFVLVDADAQDAFAADDWSDGDASLVLAESTAAAGDEALPQVQSPPALAESTVGVADEVTFDAAVLVVDGLAAAEEVLSTTDGLLADEVLAGDEVLSSATAAGAAGDEAADWSLLVDGAAAGDEALPAQESAALADDAPVLAEDEVVSRTPGATAWVLNTETGAASWYENWRFTGMAQVDGMVFAVGPDGLARVGAVLDEEVTVPAEVRFGWTDFGGYGDGGAPQGDPLKKRVEQFWFGYHSAGVLQVDVETYGQGYGPATYTMPPREAWAQRNNRIKPGRGLNARFWRVTLRSVDGAPFSVIDMAADVFAEQRKL